MTGASQGLGLEAACSLAAAGGEVVCAVLGDERQQTASAIESRVPRARYDIVTLDLRSVASVRACAAAISTRHPRLDALINDAGVFQPRPEVTADGFELHLGVNYLGHYVLTRLLSPALVDDRRARIVNVSSPCPSGIRHPVGGSALQVDSVFPRTNCIRTVKDGDAPLHDRARAALSAPRSPQLRSEPGRCSHGSHPAFKSRAQAPAPRRCGVHGGGGGRASVLPPSSLRRRPESWRNWEGSIFLTAKPWIVRVTRRMHPTLATLCGCGIGPQTKWRPYLARPWYRPTIHAQWELTR